MFEMIQRWMEIAKTAASGGNAQPWIVSYEESQDTVGFRISIDPQYRPVRSPLDMKGAGSVLALGCFSYNLEIAAATDGYALEETRVEEREDLWSACAFLLFRKSISTVSLPTVADCLERHTNRARFEKKELPSNVRKAITDLIQSFSGIKVFEFIENKEALINALYPLEKIRWRNSVLVKGLLKEISFQKSDGKEVHRIPLDQLGLNFFERLTLKMMKRFPWLHLLFKIGIYSFAVRGGLTLPIENSGAVYGIQAEDQSFRSCFNMGRCFEAAWIYINQHGLGFQPIAIPLVALNFWMDREKNFYSESERQKIIEVTKIIATQLNLDLKKPFMTFRVGYTQKDTGRSPRRRVHVQSEKGLLKSKG